MKLILPRADNSSVTRRCGERDVIDRRRKARAGLGRRRSDRTNLFRQILWRTPDEEKARRGLLVGVSATGLAMLTEHEDSPRPGARILSGGPALRGRWPAAVVTRIDRLSGLLDLVAAEYVSNAKPEEPAAQQDNGAVAASCM